MSNKIATAPEKRTTKAKENPSIRINLISPEDLLDDMQRMADQDGRSRNNMIVICLQKARKEWIEGK